MDPRRLVLVPALLSLLVCACRDDTTPGPADAGGTESSSSTSSSTESSSSTGEPNLPPPTPTLLSPEDGARNQPTELELCWEPVEDPNGDEVRYRVFVDGMELSLGRPEGKDELPGHTGPCLGPLFFDQGRTFLWTVQAFETYNPESQSEQAKVFAFSTEDLGAGVTVFDDDFEDDDPEGWEVQNVPLDGETVTGAWVRGNPVPTTNPADGNSRAQQDDCYGGQRCFFTGQNPDAVVDDEDVSGGSTVLLSPEFDLSEYEVATVQYAYYFYKEGNENGTLIRVELLVPNEDEPSGYQAFVLDERQSGLTNNWSAVERSACGITMAAGSRLRITATDLGRGITEAGFDSVRVIGYRDREVCDGGANAACNPNEDSPCPDDLLCCAQGPLNTGIYRCTPPVRDLVYDNPPPYGAPFNGELGCNAPDLFVSSENLRVCRDVITVENDPSDEYYCAYLEGCFDGFGARTVLRFNTTTPNKGSTDLRMGVPANHPDLFHYSGCHDHYHFDGYARYALTGPDVEVVATGRKQAFCLIDLGRSWAWPQDADGVYDCSNQGISAGFQDTYSRSLDCQWIDVTGVPDGTYNLEIAVNPPALNTGVPPLVERDYENNTLHVEIDLADVPDCP